MTLRQIAEELFKLHTHAELCDNGEIVYREKDIIELLEKLGFEKLQVLINRLKDNS